MRGSSAFQVTLGHHTGWRAAVVALTVCVVLVEAAWVAQLIGTMNRPALSLAFAAMAASLVLGRFLWQVPLVVLEWDGATWLLRAATGNRSETMAGRVAVCIDLGTWMLLRFVPAVPRAWARAVWVPARRGRSEAEWHEFRCALYSPRTSAQEPVVKNG